MAGAIIVGILVCVTAALVVWSFFEKETLPYPQLSDGDENHAFYLYIHNAWKFEDHFYELENRKFFVGVDPVETDDDSVLYYNISTRQLRTKVHKRDLGDFCELGPTYFMDWYTAQQPDYVKPDTNNQMYKMYF